MKNTEFSIRLKTLMAQRSLKIRDLARLMNCSEPAISAWRGGNTPTSIHTQRRLAEILGVSVEYMVFGIGEETIVFANSVESFEGSDMRKNIQAHFAKVLEDAERCPGGLAHMYIEMLLRFPNGIYSNISKKTRRKEKTPTEVFLCK